MSSGLKTKRLLLTVSSVTMQGKYIQGKSTIVLGDLLFWGSVPIFSFFFFPEHLMSTAVKD